MSYWLGRLLERPRPPARRVAAASLAFAIGLAVVVVSAERGSAAFGPWSGFVGMIGLIVLVAGLAQGDMRVLGAAVAVIGTSAVIGGNGKVHGVAGALVTAALGAALLLTVEVGQWAAELRDRQGPRGRDPRRVGMVLAAVLGGGAIGGIAVAMATTTAAGAGGMVLVVAGAVACCLLAVLTLLLGAEPRS